PDWSSATTLYLTEGESDCWTLWHHGLPALAIAGADVVGCLTLADVGGFSRLVFCPDNDKGGERFVVQARQHLKRIGYQGDAYVARLPPGVKDLNELHRRGPDAFRREFFAVADTTVAEPL